MTAPEVYGRGLMLLLPREVANMLEDARLRLQRRSSVDTIREALLDLAVLSTDMHFIDQRSAQLGLPTDPDDMHASLVRLFDYFAELQAAAREVVAEFPVVSAVTTSVPRTHRLVQKMRDALQRHGTTVPA